MTRLPARVAVLGGTGFVGRSLCEHLVREGGARVQLVVPTRRATTKTEGHGIGLAVTRRIVTRHGGEVDYVGRSALGGAHFRVLWPNVQRRKVAENA